MDIAFDPDKDAINQAKHGVSLTLADQIDWSDVLTMVDDRADYRELREIGFTIINDRMYVVVFTQRGDIFRIISLRKANSREVRDVQKS